MEWLDFLICFFLGILGVHKFRQGKIGWGVLYLCTFGLFGVGWIYDCIQYLRTAAKIGASEQKEEEKSENSLVKKVLLWILTLLFVLIAVAYLPKLAGIFALLAAVLVIPLEKWQTLLAKGLQGKWKILAVTILAVLSVPQPSTHNILCHINISHNMFSHFPLFVK